MFKFLFPSFCMKCKNYGANLCKECFAKERRYGFSRCSECNKLDKTHETCIKFRYVDEIYAIFKYSKYIGKLIHELKYNSYNAMIEDIVTGLKTDTKLNIFSDFDCIVPIPLVLHRHWSRGFNQAELIANEISKLINIPVVKYLKRVKFNRPQVGLSRSEREINVINSYTIKMPLLPNHSRILLVDDVITTGATIEECAKILKESGAKYVTGLSLCRGNSGKI